LADEGIYAQKMKDYKDLISIISLKAADRKKEIPFNYIYQLSMRPTV